MIPMDKNIRDRWVQALRSGYYKKGECCLYNADTGAHCALGVLCELAVEDGVVERIDFHNGGHSVYGSRDGDTRDDVLPPEVMAWAGLDSEIPLVEYFDEDYGNTYEAVAELNDRGVSFENIADLIEEEIQ